MSSADVRHLFRLMRDTLPKYEGAECGRAEVSGRAGGDRRRRDGERCRGAVGVDRSTLHRWLSSMRPGAGGAGRPVVDRVWRENGVEHRHGETVDVNVTDRLLHIWSGRELLRTAVRESREASASSGPTDRPVLTNPSTINRARNDNHQPRLDMAHLTQSSPLPSSNAAPGPFSSVVSTARFHGTHSASLMNATHRQPTHRSRNDLAATRPSSSTASNGESRR